VVTCAYNPTYSGGGDREHHSLRQAWAKSYQDLISTKKLGMVVHGWIPSSTVLPPKSKTLSETLLKANKTPLI
jgi:hypothetical protein